MEAHDEADGAYVLSYDSTKFSKLVASGAAVLVLTALYDAFIGSRGTERLVGLLAGAATCAAGALVLFEQSRFHFDPKRQWIVWSSRWGFRRRYGSLSFRDVANVVVERPIGDHGIPSRRICLRLADGTLLPVTLGFRPDGGNEIERAASKLRVLLGQDPNPKPADLARTLIEAGNRIEAVKLLVEEEGLSLTAAKQRIDEIKTRTGS